MAVNFTLLPVDDGGDDQFEGTGTPAGYRFVVTRTADVLEMQLAGLKSTDVDAGDFVSADLSEEATLLGVAEESDWLV